ncbi:unnamed protein product [Calypogeia fissa]
MYHFGDLANCKQEDHQSDLTEPTVLKGTEEMKRVMCSKMAVAYQKNVDIGKGPGNVVYKVGAKASQQQQCSDGSPKNSCKVHPSAHNSQNDTAVWNIIALSMCLRPQSPDSNICLASASPLSSNPSSNSLSTSGRTSSDGGDRPSPCSTTASISTSRNLSDLGGSFKDGLDQQKRSHSGCSTDSDEVKSSMSYYANQMGGIRAFQAYGAHQDSSMFYGRQSLAPEMVGPELSSSSSSIGGCDDSLSGDGSFEVSSSGDMEVESSLRSGPLHHMSELEASLPIKRGLSRFWNGKAKSFSSLADVSSIEELAKPDNPYAKRRRTTFGERHKSFPPLSRASTAGISKRPTSNSGSRGGLAMAVAMGSKLVQAPNSKKLQHSPSTYVYSSRSMSLTDLGQATSDAG